MTLVEYPDRDDSGMPEVGRLWTEPGATWWPRCRWCNAMSPDRSGKSPFETVKGDG